MQIIVTVEELRAYQQKYQQWAQSNGEAIFLEAFRRISPMDKEALRPFIHSMAATIAAEKMEWRKSHPEPKLIPSV